MRARLPRCHVAVLLAFTVASGLVTVVAPARADDGPRPVLNGHEFVPTDLVPEAFVRSYVRSSVAYAAATQIDYPPPVVAGDTLISLNGSLTYALLGFEYQQALRDWMAVRFGFGIRSRLGTELASLVQEGVTFTGGLELGWVARLRQTKTTSLCGSLTVTNQTITIIDVQQYVEDLDNGIRNPRIIDYVPTVRTSAAARWAWAVNQPFGVTLYGEGSYGDSPDRRDDSTWEYGLGASGDFDARPAWHVPMGFALAYRMSSMPVTTTTDHGSGSETSLRIAYNGKPDFVVAVDLLGVLNRENAQSKPVWAGGTALSLRYYF